MKVVHISSSISGGAGAAAFRLHSALLAEGVESVMLTRWDNIEEQHIYAYKRPLLAKIMERTFPPIGRLSYVKYNDDVRKYNAPNFPYALYNLAKSKEIQTADIVNLHWVGNMLNYRAFFKSISIPVIWTMHDLNPVLGMTHYLRDDELIRKDNKLSRLDEQVKSDKRISYEQCSQLSIACLSSYIYEISKKTGALNKRKHFMVRNCINVNIFKLKSKACMRDKWGFSHEKKIIMYVSHGVRDERKGFSLLLDAIERINIDCLFLTVGSPSGIKKDKIREMGYVDDEEVLSELYSCADALLIPSVEDNLPNTMLEALSCGVPVIAFPIGGMLDTIKTGYNGLLTSNVSIDALVSVIERFLYEGVKWSPSQIAEQAVSMFSPSVVAKDYIHVYNELLK